MFLSLLLSLLGGSGERYSLQGAEAASVLCVSSADGAQAVSSVSMADVSSAHAAQGNFMSGHATVTDVVSAAAHE